MSPTQRFFATVLGVIASAVVLIVAVVNLGKTPSRIEVSTAEPANRFSVSAEGKVHAPPDVALMSFGVTSERATVDQVTKENTDKMNAVIAAIKDRKVADKDIKTIVYQLNPVYTYPPSGRAYIRGYSLQQQAQVKVRDFDAVGDVIAAATAAGANEVGSLQFTIDDPETLKAQARKEAIEKAKQKAEAIADESGLRLGSLLNVSESGYTPPVPMYDRFAMMKADAAESAPAPAIQAGEQEIQMSVTLTYDVE